MSDAGSHGTRRGPGWPKLLIGAACLAVIVAWTFHAVDINAVIANLGNADPWIVLVELPLLLLLVWFMRAVRWFTVLDTLGARPRFLPTYVSTAVSLGLAVITPMQLGEALKVAHAKAHHGMTIATGASGFAIERIADVLVLLLLTALAGLFMVRTDMPVTFVAVVLCVAIPVGLLVAFALGRRFAPGALADAMRAFRMMAECPYAALSVFLTTLLCWLLTAFIWRAGLMAIDVVISFPAAMFMVGMVTFAIVLTAIPGGAGISEITIMSLVVQSGFSPEQGLSAALILRFLSLIAIALGIAHWLASPYALSSSEPHGR